MQKVVLYYPTTWRRYIGKLATEEDKKFNWFVCSKRYRDPVSQFYVVEISRGTKFYEPSTGHTLVVPIPDDPEFRVKLLLSQDPENKLSERSMFDIIEQYHYQGWAYTHECQTSNPDASIMCHEATFEFLPGILSLSKKETTCDLIQFAKSNNDCIRRVVPEFPSIDEIDETLQRYPCYIICRVLYEYLQQYLSKV